MDINTAKHTLDEIERKQFAYKYVLATVMNDASTVAPPESYTARGTAFGILSGETFKLQTSPELKEAVYYLYENKDEAGPEYFRRAELLRENIRKMENIPIEEYMAYSELLNTAHVAWLNAKKNNDFASFAPFIRKIVDTQIRFASITDPDKDPYDVALDAHEEGTDREYYDRFFDEVKATLIPLIAKINEKEQPDNSWLKVSYPVEVQKKLSDIVMDTFHLDRNHCVLGETEHPYTNGACSQDVRITTHYYENDPVASVFSVIHEGGHANYELHVNPEYDYNVLSGGASMAMHESQSRFWENYVGRSENFIQAFWPRFRETFPEQTKRHTAEELYRCVNLAHPSLVRTEADELTYSLHIIIRYEIEKKLFSGELAIEDIPAAWNEKYKEYLGITVPNDTLGCLQDVHWSQGSFGYFPTYSLGTAYSAQILDTMRKELDFDQLVRNNDLEPILNWLTEHIYRFGCLKKPGTYVPDITGKPFTAKYYTDYLTEKFSKLYDL
ncbi:MAG: carboxypeptidase M32 [Oscillospiraceae bacterium]|nr:carboxypeptidase M32 [Oscillospiraceae bacterium]